MREQKNKTLNTNNGITLIALVVTIVLMLILATLTVNVVIDGGLFEYAGKAKLDTEIASEKETIQKALIIAKSTSKTGRVTKEEMQKTMDKATEESATIVTDSEDGFIIKFNERNRYYKVDEGGKVEEFNYEGTLGWYIAQGEIQVGDYFEYKIVNYKENGLYSVSAEMSGYTDEQNFDAKTYAGKWRVLYNGIDENGLQIVSEGNVLGDGVKLNLTGKEGYNNLVEILNGMSAYYIEDEYAISARSLGSAPNDTQSSVGNTTVISDVQEQLDSSKVVWKLEKVQDYKYEDNNYEKDHAQLTSFPGTIYKDIFYASRVVGVGFHYGGDANFMCRNYRNYDGQWQTAGELSTVNSNGNYQRRTVTLGFSPVIKLKQSIPVYKTEENGIVTWKIDEDK